MKANPTFGRANYVTPTEHERREWQRMAEACQQAGKAVHACLYRAASLLTIPMAPWTYDALQQNYRRWLVFGTKELSDEGLDL